MFRSQIECIEEELASKKFELKTLLRSAPESVVATRKDYFDRIKSEFTLNYEESNILLHFNQNSHVELLYSEMIAVFPRNADKFTKWLLAQWYDIRLRNLEKAGSVVSSLFPEANDVDFIAGLEKIAAEADRVQLIRFYLFPNSTIAKPSIFKYNPTPDQYDKSIPYVIRLFKRLQPSQF